MICPLRRVGSRLSLLALLLIATSAVTSGQSQPQLSFTPAALTSKLAIRQGNDFRQSALTVGAGTQLGTYSITVTGSGGGIQQNASMAWGIGFDFRASSSFVSDPAGDTYVLPTTVYPTSFNGTNYGWTAANRVQARDRNAALDPRLAGINFATNGAPGTFYVDLPSAGTYSVSLALGDAGYEACWVQCQIQFLDGSTVLATLDEGFSNLGNFYDAQGHNWSAAAWPASNLSQQVTLTGSRLTVVVGTNQSTGDDTPIAFLGVAQVVTTPSFTLSASPNSVTVAQGNQGTSTITTTISDGFDSAITLSAAGVPSDTTVSFSPNPIPAPGAGNSTMTLTVGANTPTGTYPITITGNGGGVQQSATVTLTVTAPQQPNFTLSAAPAAVSVQQGNQGSSTITSTISGGFDAAISLSAAGAPSGTTVTFNPQTIPAPGSGNSTMTITVGASTPLGTYPITVTGNGGGIQQNTTVMLTATAAGGWAIGFDFRNTSTFVTDPPGDTYVLSSTAYPIFQKDCAKCHGKTAEGRHFGGPSFLSEKIAGSSADDLRSIITEGKGRMPKYASKLTAEQINTLVGQIKALNKKMNR